MNEIRHRVGIKASCSAVYQAVFHPNHLTGWWAAKANGETTVGSHIGLEFPGYPNFTWEIAELNENEKVHLKLIEGPEPWHGSELIFELHETGSQVFVTLTHNTTASTPADAYQYFCTKWPLFLVSLKDYLETGEGRPYPDDIQIQHD